MIAEPGSVCVAAKSVGTAVAYTAVVVELVPGVVYVMLAVPVGSVKVPLRVSTSPECEQLAIAPPGVVVAESYTNWL